MNKVKFSILVLGVVMLVIFGTTSAMAKCGGSMMAKPQAKSTMKCGAGKCGGSTMTKPMMNASGAMAKSMMKVSNTVDAKKLKSAIIKVNNMKCGAAKKAVFLDIAKIKKQMIKKELISADNMKCGASKKSAIKHAKKLKGNLIQAGNMKCGSSKKAAIMAVKVN